MHSRDTKTEKKKHFGHIDTLRQEECFYRGMFQSYVLRSYEQNHCSFPQRQKIFFEVEKEFILNTL